jgi:hypothetical protein
MSKAKTFLSKDMQGFLASCLVIISIFVLIVNFIGFNARSYATTAIIDTFYALALWGYVSLFTGASKSELLKRVMVLFSIVATFISILLSWFMMTLSL